MTFQYMQREFPLSTFKGGEINLTFHPSTDELSTIRIVPSRKALRITSSLEYDVILCKHVTIFWANGLVSMFSPDLYKSLISEMYLRG